MSISKAKGLKVVLGTITTCKTIKKVVVNSLLLPCTALLQTSEGIYWLLKLHTVIPVYPRNMKMNANAKKFLVT